MKPNVHTFELIYRLAITFSIIVLLGCGSGSNSADNESLDGSATITFQIKFNQSSNHAIKIPVNHAIGEPDICNDYLIDKIGVQVYRTQDDSEVASAEEDCAEHSLTISNVPASETLRLVCRGYVGSNQVWQGRIDNIVAVAGQNNDLGIIDMNYIGNDGIAPEVVSTFPAADATNVDLNASIVVVFSENLAPSTIPDQAITVIGNDIPVSGQVGYDAAFNSIRFLPANAFDPDTTYTVALQTESDDSDPITDTTGHPLDPSIGFVGWQFTTRGTDDDAAPQVVAVSPQNGATNVDLQTHVSVLFSEPMDADSLTNSAFQLSSDQGTVSGQIAYDDQTRTLSMTPYSTLNAATLYTVVLSTQARDLAQNPLSETYTWRFRSIGDVIMPDLTNLTVSAGVDPKTLYFTWDVDRDDDVDNYRLEVDPDGASGFSVMAGGTDITTTDCTVTIAVHLTDWFNALFRVVALDAADNELATSNVADLFNHVTAEEVIGYVKASNTDADDRFGCSVALSADSNTLAVGASYESSLAIDIDGNQNNNTAPYSGAVYLFARNAAGAWNQQAYVKASNTETHDRFGFSVALSADGNTLAVGARGESSDADGIDKDQTNNDAGQAGAVYLFTRNAAGAWGQQAYIKASNSERYDNFGHSVALSADGNTLAVGASGEDSNANVIGGDQTNNDAENAGAVYLFTRNAAGAWGQQAYIKASNANIYFNNGYDRSDAAFGHSVALSADGNTLAVGAHGEDSAATHMGGDQNNVDAENAGAVYLFSRNTANVWSQQVYVKASNTGSGDRFGQSVALSGDGNTMAVGAYKEASAATVIDGDEENDNAPDSGAVYLFSRNTANAWIQQAYIKASNNGEDERDEFGWSVALSADGTILAVGAQEEFGTGTGLDGDQNDKRAYEAGAVYLFSRNAANVWSQQAYVKASNTDPYDHFGQSMALSADGNTLAVGAEQEDSNATDINGESNNNGKLESGAVYLY